MKIKTYQHVARPIEASFSGNTTQPFDPTTISGLWVWYRGDSASPTTWTDKSGNGRDAAAADGTVIVDATAANGKPCVAADSTFAFALPDMSALAAGEAFFVLKNDTDPGVGTSGGLHTIGNSGSGGTIYNYQDGNIYDSFGRTTRPSIGPAPAPLTSWHVYNTISTSAEWTASFNGTQFSTTATNTVAFNATPFLLTQGGAFKYLGKMAEVLLFNRKLTTPERSYINTGLKNYYTIP